MDASNADSLAGDIRNMLESAANSGLDLKSGFQSTPINGPHVFLNYLFQSGASLKKTPGMPESFKSRLKKANVLATIDVGRQKVGIFVLCALDKAFSTDLTLEDIRAGMDVKGVEDFEETLRQVLKADLEGQMGKTH